MKRYSHMFSTLHDEDKPVAPLGRGTHYSVLRAVIWDPDPKAPPYYHDFAVLWDEDHDDRVIWTVEQLYIRRMLSPILMIGERKGSITALTERPMPASFEKQLEDITQENPSDPFCGSIGTLDEPNGIINDARERVVPYLKGIHALWQLGRASIVKPPAPEVSTFAHLLGKPTS